MPYKTALEAIFQLIIASDEIIPSLHPNPIEPSKTAHFVQILCK